MFRLRLTVILAVLVALVRGADAAPDDTPIAPGASITVEQAVEIALRYHPAGQAAQASADAGRERVGEARAALFPQVGGVAEYLRATDNGIGSTTYINAGGLPRIASTGRHDNQLTDTFDNYLAGISAYQYLFDFGRTRGLINQRSAEADAEQARLRLVQLDIVFQVSRAYYGLVAARQIVHVFDEAVKERREQVHQAQVKAETGLKPEIDVYTAQAGLSRANLQLVDARNAAATAKVTLDNAMGVGESSPEYTQSTALTYSAVPAGIESFVETALAQRPDLAMLVDEARAAGAQIDQYRGDYLPKVGAVAGYSARGQDETPGNNYYAGVVITWPIFNGFATDHEVAEAKFRQQAIEQNLRNLRQQVILQVKRSFLDWQASVERVHQADQMLDAARVELELASKRYENGLGSIIELNDAQQEFTRDEAERVQALAGFSVAKAALDRDTGRGIRASHEPLEQ